MTRVMRKGPTTCKQLPGVRLGPQLTVSKGNPLAIAAGTKGVIGLAWEGLPIMWRGGYSPFGNHSERGL